MFLSARDAERQMHRLLYVETRNVKENSQSEWYPDRIFADDFGKNRPAPIVTADYPVLIRRIFEWNMKV